mmetsp:Transcript_543/g.1368  ORF Transcript_543/g.1368 Transcript_543/m.1368 type:complete len:225 (+) Transcript_543:1293-1967(+)
MLRLLLLMGWVARQQQLLQLVLLCGPRHCLCLLLKALQQRQCLCWQHVTHVVLPVEPAIVGKHKLFQPQHQVPSARGVPRLLLHVRLQCAVEGVVRDARGVEGVGGPQLDSHEEALASTTAADHHTIAQLVLGNAQHRLPDPATSPENGRRRTAALVVLGLAHAGRHEGGASLWAITALCSFSGALLLLLLLLQPGACRVAVAEREGRDASGGTASCCDGCEDD